MNSGGGRIKDVRLQWGEVPSSIGTCTQTLHVDDVDDVDVVM